MGNTCRNAANHCLWPAAVASVVGVVSVLAAVIAGGTGSSAMAFRFSVSSERSIDECIYTPMLCGWAPGELPLML